MILNRTAALLRANLLPVMAAMIVLTILGMAADLQWTDSGGQFLVSAATLAMQFWLTVMALDALGLRTTAAKRFPTFFILGIATSLGILLGVVLLVLPGIYLLVRWSIAVPAVIAADHRFTEAIAYSWRETEGHFWPILLAFIAIYGVAAAGAVAGVIMETEVDRFGGTLLFELSINSGFVVGWHAAVAIYAETLRDRLHADVFA
jgi:hypothetical protein